MVMKTAYHQSPTVGDWKQKPLVNPIDNAGGVAVFLGLIFAYLMRNFVEILWSVAIFAVTFCQEFLKVKICGLGFWTQASFLSPEGGGVPRHPSWESQKKLVLNPSRDKEAER